LKPTKLKSAKMLDLFQKGRISEQTLLLFGISGELPEIESYSTLNHEEKAKIWSDKLEESLGLNWKTNFNEHTTCLPIFSKPRDLIKIKWTKEGF